MLCRAVQTSAITNFLQIFITMTIENKHSKKISIVKVKRSTQKYLYIFSTEKMKIIFITIALASMIQVVPAPFCSPYRGCYSLPEHEEEEFWCENQKDCEEKFQELWDMAIPGPYLSSVAKNKREKSREFCTFSPLP